MVVFGNLLDLAVYNAYVLFSHVHPEYEAGKSHRRRLFLEKLALDLVQDAVSDRAAAVDAVTAGVPVDPWCRTRLVKVFVEGAAPGMWTGRRRRDAQSAAFQSASDI